MKKEKILGVNDCVTNYDDLKKSVNNDIKNNKKSFVVAINPEKIMKSRKDNELKNLLNIATYQIPDGIGVVYASKMRGGNITSRITGIDSMNMLCSLANEEKYRIFLYGAKEEVVSKASKILKEKYPNMEVAGYISGYERDIDKIIKKINSAKPNILFVALGSPKQENFITNNINALDCNIFQGVGGSFDVISGNVKRAPMWMQKCGLEWLYRLIKEPKRIFRQLKLFGFIFVALFERREK